MYFVFMGWNALLLKQQIDMVVDWGDTEGSKV